MRWLPIPRIRTLTFVHEPLVALISLQTLQNVLHVLGYPAVTLFILIESAGVPFPGETMLLLASFYAAIDGQLQLPIIIACAAAGAIVGDNIGYYVGHTGGRAFVERFGRYLFLKPQHLDRAEKFFDKHGNKTVFFGRFIAILRTWAAFLAGLNQMHWRTFLIYNAAGGILWAIVYGIIGYLAGRVFHDNFTQVEHIARTVSWIGAGAIIVGAIAIFFIVRWRRKQSAARLNDDKARRQGEKDTAARDELVPPSAISTDHHPEGSKGIVSPSSTSTEHNQENSEEGERSL